MNNPISWLCLDFEVQNHPWYGSVASPHCPDNYIVATGWSEDASPVQAMYHSNADEQYCKPFAESLSRAKNLVCHNATFELQWLMKVYPEDIKDFFKRGGKLYCSQYAEYLLSHQLDMYPKLEDCAIKYGGTKKIDEVKILWEQGVLTADIDQALLMQYLGDNTYGDVANTRRVCFGQVAELRKHGMMGMFKERMDSLVFNAIATYFGLYVDTEVAARNQEQQENEINEIKQSILSMLPSDLPSDLEFSFTSDYHRSAFLFGGTIQYKAKVSYPEPKFVKEDYYVFGE